MEYAHGKRKSSIKRDIMECPTFANHLRREGINFAEFERRQRLTADRDAQEHHAALRRGDERQDIEMIELSRRNLQRKYG